VIGIRVNAAKSMFFDRVILNAVNKAEIKTLSKMGAFVRTSARSSIRKAGGQKRLVTLFQKLNKSRGDKRKQIQAQIDEAKKKQSSRPGQPPKGHGAQLLKKFLYFGYDSTTRSVVVGPAKLSGRRYGMAPSILEGGGAAEIGKRRVAIEARPYMGPALTKNTPKFPSLWANAVTN
jgi:hypothetical protein